MPSETKKCFKCGQELPVDSFYRHARMADGLLGKCKTCTKRDVREHRAKDPDRWIRAERARAMLPHRVEARAAYRQTESGKAAVRRAHLSYIDKNPLRRKAQIAAGNAVRDGRLIKAPCEICARPKAQAHHDDYTKPLEVRWLCSKHHAQWHKTNTPKP